MSKEICHHDQCKLNQILEQVEALSDVVDELRIELNHLMKISFNVNRENICFESLKENNKIDYASSNVLQKVKTYFKNIGFFTKINETLIKNSQILKKEDQEIRFPTVYDSLKYFKNKVIKNIQSIRKTQQQQSTRSTKNKCVTSNQEQNEVCFSRRKEEQKFLKFNGRNEDVNKYTNISEELNNWADTLFTSDASTQIDITICSRQKNNKSYNCNRLASRNITENNKQTIPLSVMNDDQFVIHLDKFADKLSNSFIRKTFLKNKIKKYKKCLCRKQCPFVQYKLPCNKYRYSTAEKKIDDEISGLSLECLSFEERRDFPKFISVDTIRNNKCFTDSSPVEFGMDESLTSSLSMDLEVDVCNDYFDLDNVNEFTERRKARTYIVNRTKKDDLIKGFKAENELLKSFNIISSWRNINEKKEKIDETVKKILSQRRYIYSEESQDNKKSGTENYISNHWPIKNNKQIQCVIPALTLLFNRKISVKTSTSDFQEGI